MSEEIKQLLIDCANFIQPYNDGGNRAERLIIRLDEALKTPDIVKQNKQLFCECKEHNKRWIGEDDDMHEECFKCRKDISK